MTQTAVASGLRAGRTVKGALLSSLSVFHHRVGKQAVGTSTSECAVATREH